MPSITVGQSIGSINKTYQRSGDDPINVEVTLPAGKAVTAWVKTDANTAACDLPSGHGYTDGKFDVYWSGGYRYGVDGTISTNALSLDGGAGTDFPSSATTGVVVCKRVVINKAIDGDNLAAIGLSYELASSSGYGSLVLAFDAINAGGSAVGSVIALDPNTPYIADIEGGATNPFTGNPILSLVASNGDSSNAAVLKIAGIQDITP